MRQSKKPSVVAIRDAIRDLLGPAGVTLASTAAYLDTSRSQVQRVMADAGTSFTEELRTARLEVAMKRLLVDRWTVAETAEAVGIAPDYLRELLVRVWGIPPGHVRRAMSHTETLSHWRRSLPPAYGTKLYRQRRRRLLRIDRDLHRMLDPVPATSPIRQWADDVLAYAVRPDLRRQPHRDRVRREREAERLAATEAFDAFLRDVLAGKYSGGYRGASP